MALTNKLSAIGDAIRVKTGTTELLTLDQMPSAISSITTASEPNLEELTVTANGIYIPTESDGYSKVTVEVEGGAEAPYTSLWENGTWEEISAVLTQYYNGEITDLSPYFRVGDIRNIHTDDIASYGGSGSSYVCAAREARDMPWVIIGIEHDDLRYTSDAGITKAAITIIPYFNYTGSVYWGTSGGSSSSSTTPKNNCSWIYSQARSWLQSPFYNAVEEDCRNLIKEVIKSTGIQGASGISITYDKIWLLSPKEITNSALSADNSEQYEWFKDGKYGSKYHRIRSVDADKEAAVTHSNYITRSGYLSYSSYKYYPNVYYCAGLSMSSISPTGGSTSGACMGMCL